MPTVATSLSRLAAGAGLSAGLLAMGLTSSVQATVSYFAYSTGKFTLVSWLDDQNQPVNDVPKGIRITGDVSPGAGHDNPPHGSGNGSLAGGGGSRSPDFGSGKPGSSMELHVYAYGRTSPTGHEASDMDVSATITVTNAGRKAVTLNYTREWFILADTWGSDAQHESSWAIAEAKFTLPGVMFDPPGKVEAHWPEPPGHDRDSAHSPALMPWDSRVTIAAGGSVNMFMSLVAKGAADAWGGGGTPTPGTACVFGMASLGLARRRR